MRCHWDQCNQDVHDIRDHLSDHIGYKRSSTFTSACKWKCCNIKKDTRSRLMSHIISHLDLRIFKCHCGRFFKRRCDLKSHQEKCESEFDKIVKGLFDGLPFLPFNFDLK